MVSSIATLLTVAAALAAVLGLVWLASRAARWGGLAPRVIGARRLVVQDALALDARRRLTLVHCDDRAVLLLTGGSQDLVVGQWSVGSGQRSGGSRQRSAVSGQQSGLEQGE